MLISLALVAHPALAQDPADANPPALVPPVVLDHVDAEYPSSLVSAGKHADVVLAVTVDTEGHIAKVEVLTSGGDAMDAAAIAAVRQWTFKAGLKRGVATSMRIPVPFHFSPPSKPVEVPQSQTQLQAGSAGAGSGGSSVTTPIAPIAAPTTGDSPQAISVHGSIDAPPRGSSDHKIELKELSHVPHPEGAAGMLKLAPGILLTNEGGEGHAEQVFLRGFDAREGQDIEFTVGNIPFNEAGNLHGNGYADAHFIIPELVRSLRVMEGPFDPRQGNFAVAGSADYELGLDKRGMTVKYTGGSFNTQRLVLLWGPKEEGEHTFAGADLGTTDGFGMNRDARHATAMGQYEGKLGERGLWRITATAYTTQYHSAGVVRQDDYLQGRVGFGDTYDPRQGGSTSRFGLSGEIQTRNGDTTFVQRAWVSLKQMRLLENFTGSLLDVQSPIQSPHDQRGDLLDLQTNGVTVGAKGAARWHTTAFKQRQDVELGYFARGDVTGGTQDRIETATNVPYKRETDVNAFLGDVGLYGDLSLRATKWLGVRGGVRADLFTFNVHDSCAVHDVAHPNKIVPPGDTSCLSQQDFGRFREPDQRATTASAALMPRGTLLVGPFSHVTLSASYGRGVRSIDPVYVTQDVGTPFAAVNAVDAGATYANAFSDTFSLSARSTFFSTHVDRDLIFSETAGRNVLGNGTTRTGWSGSVRATGAFLDEAANVTFVRSTFDDTHLLVPYVPDVVVRSDTALYGKMPFKLAGDLVKGTLALGVTYVGKRALPYGQRSDAIFTVDASGMLEWRAFEIGVVATNLFNQKYRSGEYNYPSDFHSQQSPTLVPMRQFTAGAPLGIFGTFAIHFGGT